MGDSIVGTGKVKSREKHGFCVTLLAQDEFYIWNAWDVTFSTSYVIKQFSLNFTKQFAVWEKKVVAE